MMFTFPPRTWGGRPSLTKGALALLAVLCWATPLMAEDITVGIDQAHLLRLKAPAAEIIVGNPSIADISVQSGDLIVITGKTFGVSNLIVLDAGGREILNRKVTVRTDPHRVVTLHRGAARQSYNCVGDCQPIVMPGDAQEFLDATASAASVKAGLATGAITGDNAASGQ